MLQAVWIEIPVKDLERALKFYQGVFELQPTEIVDEGVRRTSILTNSSEGGGTGLSLNQNASFETGDTGPLIYLNTGEDMSPYIARVVQFGGLMIEGKTSMGSTGSYATFRDTEGNVLALYSYP